MENKRNQVRSLFKRPIYRGNNNIFSRPIRKNFSAGWSKDPGFNVRTFTLPITKYLETSNYSELNPNQVGDVLVDPEKGDYRVRPGTLKNTSSFPGMRISKKNRPHLQTAFKELPEPILVQGDHRPVSFQKFVTSST